VLAPVTTCDTHDDDAALMARIRDGDHASVEILVRRYQHELVGFFYNQCWDQGIAEELAQDTFVNLYRARERWVPTAKVRTYLYRIAHNLWIDHLRRRRRLVSLDREDEDGGSLVDGLAAPRQDPVQTDPGRSDRIRERVQTALGRLGAGHREVFLLANNQAMRYHEIAEVLGIPEGTVKSRMHHAVRVLRESLADLVEEMQP
jgi:RNA polymerase sigma-70 factor (ECF subfamily)